MTISNFIIRNAAFETKVEIRQAFASRRNSLISNWLLAVQTGHDASHWAARITACNDAELAVIGGLN